ncbi:tumor protein p53-inducible protein 11-like isoform X2 [Patiria miniata]|uniref:Tumor protein p53-inducible protein 11 n=1 Tax=Patiria miniata TaxID=46514 RepID=A0A913ZCU2_PATMI|nr:tumor protein p53-inducible protein 11-like isoform X2 [Patiria miniata]
MKQVEDFSDDRKQSSGDLQSRLKTRKLLGVGECEDGSVPVSKISQILGSDDHYLMTLPNGLRLWQVATALVFTAVALLAMIFPVALFDAIFASNCSADAILPIRLFGAALTCLGLLFWSAVKSVSRYIIRWTLLSQVLYLSIQVAADESQISDSDSDNNVTPQKARRSSSSSDLMMFLKSKAEKEMSLKEQEIKLKSEQLAFEKEKFELERKKGKRKWKRKVRKER